MEPRFNEPLYNENLCITNDFPAPVVVKSMEKNLDQENLVTENISCSTTVLVSNSTLRVFVLYGLEMASFWCDVICIASLTRSQIELPCIVFSVW